MLDFSTIIAWLLLERACDVEATERTPRARSLGLCRHRFVMKFTDFSHRWPVWLIHASNAVCRWREIRSRAMVGSSMSNMKYAVGRKPPQAQARSRRDMTRGRSPLATPDVGKQWSRPIRRAMAIFLLSIAASVLMVTIGIWLQGGGITGVRTGADALTSVGRLTGLLAAYSLLLELLLMARLPFVELAAGWARTSAWHKLNGKICLGLIVAHVVLVIVGYALVAKVSVSSEAVQMVRRLSGMPAAVIGTSALVLVVITSLYLVRSRLRYESWYLVHLLAYAGVLLAWFHQIPTSTLFVSNPVGTAVWTAMYVGTLQFVVLFRLGQPLFRALWHRMKVAQVTDEGEGVVSVLVTGRHLDSLNAQSGQFFIWRFLAPGMWTEAHPFSLSAAPDGRSLRITVKSVGDFTSRLKMLRPGTTVVAEGPFGTFTEEVRKQEGVALIAGGIGITPIRALLEDIEGKVVVIYRVIREEEAYLRHELDDLARKRGAAIHYVVGDHRDPANRQLMSAKHLKSLVPDLAQRDVYLCGPPAMMRMVEASVKRVGVPARSVHTDKFAL